MRVVYPEEMAGLDRAAAEAGVPSLQLMERAGRAVAEQARDMLGFCAGRKVVVVAAKGNNGGDGLVAARYLSSWGAEVRVFLWAEPGELSPDSAANYRAFLEQGGEVSPGDAESLRRELIGADLVVDALFGFGFRGRAEGVFAEAIEVINQAGAPVLSVDLPSGVEGGTGAVNGPAVRATRTVTLALPKTGLYLYPGAEMAGELVVADIGMPLDLLDGVVKSRLYVLQEEDARDLLPRRSPFAHKGECGRVLVVAGSEGLTGAAALCSRAAMRAGAGVVTLGIPAALNPVMEVKLTEVMTLPLPGGDGKRLHPEGVGLIVERLAGYDVLALGPGLGTAEPTVEAVRDILRRVDKPVVLDADGINCLAGEERLLRERGGPTVITPHPGELGRLLGMSSAEVQGARLDAAQAAAARTGCVTVLKGANTVIADPGGKAFFHPLALPGLATAGSGDVLTGCLAAMWAQGMEPLHAALCGVSLHGKAAQLAAELVGRVGLVAGDLVSHLPLVLSAWLREKEGGGRV